MPVTKRNNSWQASVMHGGKRVRYSFRTEQEARVWEKEAELAAVKGIAPPPREMVETPSGKVSRPLIELYRLTHQTRWASCWSDAMTELGLRVTKELGEDTDVSTIDFGRIASWIGDLRKEGLTQATINRRLSALSTMLTVARRMGWISEKPQIPLSKEARTERRYLTFEEERMILAQLEGRREWGLVVVAADTGLRIGELVSLKWRSVRPESVTVEKSKNGSARTVPLTKRSREVIMGIPRDGDGPFCGMNPHEASRRFKAAAVSAGILDKGVVFHSLRHTCASRLVQAGVDLMRVKTWMGHKAVATTLIYAHLAPQSLSDVVSRLDDCIGEKISCEIGDTICGRIGTLSAG